jgi:hypothetical protein
VNKAIYIKIKDDGNGSSYGSNVGYDLDAVGVIWTPIVDLGNDTTLLPGESIILDAGNPGCTYFWSTGETTQTITVDTNGTGTGSILYSVTVTNLFNHSGTDDIQITFSGTSGIRDNPTESAISAYPNPSNGWFALNIKGFNDGICRLFSSSGKMIFESNIHSDDFCHDLNLTDFPSGIYTLEVSVQHRHITRKLVLQ